MTDPTSPKQIKESALQKQLGLSRIRGRVLSMDNKSGRQVQKGGAIATFYDFESKIFAIKNQLGDNYHIAYEIKSLSRL